MTVGDLVAAYLAGRDARREEADEAARRAAVAGRRRGPRMEPSSRHRAARARVSWTACAIGWARSPSSRTSHRSSCAASVRHPARTVRRGRRRSLAADERPADGDEADNELEQTEEAHLAEVGERRRRTPHSSRRARLGAADARPARRRARVECRADGPHRQGPAHPRDACALRHRREGGPHPGGSGRDAVRPRRRPGHQAQPDRGAVRQPGACPRGAEHPDRGADPGRAVRRRRDPELRLRPRDAQGGAGQPHPRRGRQELEARLRPRPGRRRTAVQRRPVEDAAPADRRRHRLRQERLRQRDHRLVPHERHADRGEADPDRPEARRAGAVQGHPAPADRRHRRARQGRQRAEVDGRDDGEPLRRVREPRRSQHRRLQRGAAARPARGCRTSSSSSTSWPT